MTDQADVSVGAPTEDAAGPSGSRSRLIPYAVLCELTHRCPLQCPYCSNPLELERASREIDTDTWKSVLSQAVDMGILQAHFSGGEPTVRKDLEQLVEHAAKAGLYTNLITSGVLLTRARLDRLRDAGLDHVQVSFQDTEAGNADRIAGFRGHAKKQETARMVRAADLPLTVNAVMHRQNLHHLEAMIAMAVERGTPNASKSPRCSTTAGHSRTDRRSCRRGSSWTKQRRSSRRPGSASRASWRSTTWCPTTTRADQNPAWAAGAASSSTSRRPARCCPATRRNHWTSWSSRM